jgi:hypothetical protein
MAVGDFLISLPQITAVSEVIPEKIWSRDYHIPAPDLHSESYHRRFKPASI